MKTYSKPAARLSAFRAQSFHPSPLRACAWFHAFRSAGSPRTCLAALIFCAAGFLANVFPSGAGMTLDFGNWQITLKAPLSLAGAPAIQKGGNLMFIKREFASFYDPSAVGVVLGNVLGEHFSKSIKLGLLFVKKDIHAPPGGHALSGGPGALDLIRDGHLSGSCFGRHGGLSCLTERASHRRKYLQPKSSIIS